jgi:serine/threonine protein kinase
VGTGGFATVYRSWQVAVGREVAVKVDNRVLLSDRDRRRFVREVTAAGRLSGHPHVIDVYDAGTLADGRPYLVMELCPAGSLNDLLRRHGPMSPAQVRDIGIRIGDALAAAHAAGILHRDIKPANILVNRYGVVGLSDFGLASILAAEGEQSATRDALTPAYAPPESFRSEVPTVAADLYSLAATLYALLAGRPPRFPADGRSPSPAVIMMLHHEPVEDVPGAPPELMALLRQSVAPDPRERPPSAAALRDALAALPARPAGTSADAPMPAGPARPGRHASHGPAPATPSPVSPGTHPPTVTAIPRRNPSGPAPPISPSGPGKHSSPSGPAPSISLSGPAPPISLSGPAQYSHPSGPAQYSHPSGPAQYSRPSGPAQQGSPGGPGFPGPQAGQSADGHVPGGQDANGRVDRERPERGGRRVTTVIAAAAGLVLAIGAALVIGAHLFPHGTTGGPSLGAGSPGSPGGAAPGVFGVRTVTQGCPAASVRGAAAQCPAAPECWNGLVVTSGSATAASLPCFSPHTWQTFAIGILPADVRTYDQNIVQANPAVRAVCSLPVLLKSRLGPARRFPDSSWEIQVLPPDEAAFDSGARAYRCVAARIGANPATSDFGA